MNFQESTTILNACTKKSGNIWNAPRIHTHTHTHTYIYIYINIYIYIYTLQHEQDAIQCQSLMILNCKFSFFETGCLSKTKEPGLPYYFLIAGGRENGFMPFEELN